MYLQFLLAFAFSFQAISCTEPVSNILDLVGLNCKSNKSWEQKVKKCYDGCVKVFERYPNQIFGIGENLIDSFKSYINAATIWNESDSVIMSTQSTNLLETIGLLANLGQSPSCSLFVHRKANPKLFLAYRAIVNALPEYINQLTHPINDALTDLQHSFDDLFNQFSQQCVSRSDAFDFNRIMKSGQRLANTINLIVEASLNHPCNGTISNDTCEAIAILVCILFDNILNIQGAIISEAALLKYRFDINSFHYSCLLSLDPFIRGVAGSMNTMTVDIVEGVRNFLASLVNNMGGLNHALNTLLGPCEDVTITVEYVIMNLLTTTS